MLDEALQLAYLYHELQEMENGYSVRSMGRFDQLYHGFYANDLKDGNRALPFALRLITAMEAGEDAGGDKRGKQAAALIVRTSEPYPALDLRVDDHVEPIVELRRLYEKSLERFQPFAACLPRHDDPAGVTDRAAIEAAIERFRAARLHRSAMV